MLLMMVAAGAFVAACAMGVDDNKGPSSEQDELTADELTADQSMATEGGAGSHAELAAGAMTSATSSAVDDVIKPHVSCRRVTAAGIPVFSTPNGSGVLCSFFQGDRFSYFGVTGLFSRLTTWCPRGVPKSQGITGYAQLAGTAGC
jgi:hypothetical protein